MQRATHALTIAENLAVGVPTDDPCPVPPSAIENLQGLLYDELGRPDDPSPEDPVLAQVVHPLIDARDDLLGTSSYPGGWREFAGKLKSLGEVARAVQGDLLSNTELSAQSVDDVVDDLAREFRLSMSLCLTANYALSQQVIGWRGRRSDGSRPAGYLDMLTFDLVREPSNTTVSMHDLADNSTGRPVVLTQDNWAAAHNAMMDGEETPPAMYQMAYGQWFISIFAAWDEFYRPSLAAAHNRADPDARWRRNDIRSEFFNAIKLIRHDFVHNSGVCENSRNVEIVDWLTAGELIAPSPIQMMNLLEQFSEDDLRRTPMRQPGPPPKQLRYGFDAEWVDQLEKYVTDRYQVKADRVAAVQKVLDGWMKTGQENTAP